ncbi:elongation factor P maturation arginine rhamnosyltransferase EarP [Pseudomonas sp. Marseille-QA0892]
MPRHWDIFCSVVDNYGDIGVTWRLARQLVAEHGQAVRLWVDDLHAFKRLCPEADGQAACQTCRGVEVRAWVDGVGLGHLVDVVIEAFACQLPAAIEDELRAASPAPCWINLEYLSAEPWIESCHGLPSPQGGGLSKYFFFPGFTPATGGLLREHDLIERRNIFRASPVAQREFLARLGVTRRQDALLVSLFTYENPALAQWLDVLVAGASPTQVLVPEGRALNDICEWAGNSLAIGDTLERGSLVVQVVPFMSQPEFDYLLWACDFNVVRGEDSFVRAQWAGRPMLWHIYPQDDDAHLDKLDAFLARYIDALPEDVARCVRDLWQGWNTQQMDQAVWGAWQQNLETIEFHARAWCDTLCTQADLAAQLVRFTADH